MGKDVLAILCVLLACLAAFAFGLAVVWCVVARQWREEYREMRRERDRLARGKE